MRFARLAWSAASGGLFSALTPITAVLLLPPTRYGLFSIVYLVFAFGISLQYSIVNEAWARNRAPSVSDAEWTAFSGALISLSALVAIAATVIAFVLPGLRAAAFFLALSVFFALNRNGSRYHSVAVGVWRRVVISDSAGIAAFAVALVVLDDLPGIQRVAASWFASALVAFAVLKLPRFARGAGPVTWARRHAGAIRTLLADSLLMDFGAIGTPFILAGFLGAAPFGTYRAVSNAALPVRLLVDPVRPILGAMHARVLFSRGGLLAVGGVAAFLTGASFTLLEYVIPRIGFSIGTLSSLVPFAAPAAAFVTGSFLGTVFYIACRTKATRRALLIGRAVQTGVVVVAPLLGFSLGGLNGAIWGFAISSLAAAASWTLIAYGLRRLPRSPTGLDIGSA